jgi:transcriptional regulator with XRE-family HTH domain
VHSPPEPAGNSTGRPWPAPAPAAYREAGAGRDRGTAVSTATRVVHTGRPLRPTVPVRRHPRDVSSFDLSGVLRRIRRRADLSQRELAAACGLPQSAVAQAESGRRDLPVGALVRAAEQAGLRLALLDAAGREVAGMSPDAVRDAYGRRFPAHLDTHFADERAGRYEHRYDRGQPWFTVDVDRGARDDLRRRLGTPPDHHPVRPGDSPQERRARRQEAARQRRQEARRAGRRRRAAGALPGVPLSVRPGLSPAVRGDDAGQPAVRTPDSCRTSRPLSSARVSAACSSGVRDGVRRR